MTESENNAKQTFVLRKRSSFRTLSLPSLFIILFIWIWLLPCHSALVVTVGPNSSYTYQDFQVAIDASLALENESEVIIKLAGGDYSSTNGFTADIGTSDVQKMTIMPMDSNAEVVMVQSPGSGSYLDVVSIKGNTAEDKEIAIHDISFAQGAYYSSNGLHVSRGFKKVSIKNCYFTNLGRSIFIDSNIAHGGIHEIEIAENTFEYTVGTSSSQYESSILYSSGGFQTVPETASFSINNNVFTGRMQKHMEIMFNSAIPSLIIENNTFFSELVNSAGQNLAFHADAIIQFGFGNSIDESSYVKPSIRNNVFTNSGIKLISISADIESNLFHDTFDNLNESYIKVLNEQSSNSSVDRDRTVGISRNVFRGDLDSAIVLSPYASIYAPAIVTAQISNNSFISCNRALSIRTYPSLLDGPAMVPLFASNLLIDHMNPVEVFELMSKNQLQLNPPILARNCFLEDDPALYSYQNLSQIAGGFGDPLIDLGEICDYSLIWSSSAKSPLINAGCPVIDGVIQSDPDGTPPDIGARYYPHHHRKYFDRTDGSGIYWLSFPVLDDKSQTNGSYWNELGFIFDEYMYEPYQALNQIHWSYDGDIAKMEYVANTWIHTGHTAEQPKGYKVKFDPEMNYDPLLVNGFKADPVTTPVAWVEEYLHNGQMQDFLNSIGYFVPDTQDAGYALSRNLPGSSRFTYLDFVHTIKTRNWSTYRISEEMNSPWIIDPDTYTLSEGDMVELLLLPGAPEEMYWNVGLHVAPRERPRATAFSYEEKLDYTSLIIEFDPDDLPREVGVYIDGECKGASVVDSSVVDICVYPDEAKSGGEASIVFYYEGKGGKAAQGWKLYNPKSMVFEDGTLSLNGKERYSYISFKHKAGDSLVPLVTALHQNYPNPFNPDTNISFILGSDMPVILDVFNIKGQKVKRLCDRELPRGQHSIQWNGRDANNRPVASGMYFYRLSSPEGVQTRKMMLMK